MRFEFWIDYLCPITYLTHKNLIETMNELNIKDYEFYYRSYQLDNEDKERLIKANRDLIEKFDLKIKDFDTDLLHQVAHLAKRKDLATEFTTLALVEIFENNKDLSDPVLVKKVALESGLLEEDIDSVLTSKCYTKQISCNKINALGRKIDTIPHIRINMKHNFRGFLEKEQMKNAVEEIVNELCKTVTCENGSCSCTAIYWVLDEDMINFISFFIFKIDMLNYIFRFNVKDRGLIIW